MQQVSVFDCLLYYFIDYMETIIENGKITGFVYRSKPLD